jgi:hypothetical protein
MNRSSRQRPVVARAATTLLVAAVSALVALHPSTVAAQAAAAPLPTPVVSNATAAATNAALQNSLQNAQQQLQQGQIFQYQLQQQAVNNEFRALNGY